MTGRGAWLSLLLTSWCLWALGQDTLSLTLATGDTLTAVLVSDTPGDAAADSAASDLMIQGW